MEETRKNLEEMGKTSIWFSAIKKLILLHEFKNVIL
jgi:hypothetical protein